MRQNREFLSEITPPAWGRSAFWVLMILGWAAFPARADITPLSSQLTASSVADVDPDVTPNTPDSDADGTPDGNLRPMSVSTSQTDLVLPDLSELVTASASVTYSGNDALTVQMVGTRSGTDATFGSPGGEYSSKAHYGLSFQNLAVGEITVDWSVSFERNTTGTFTPLGVIVRRGGIVVSDGPTVAFADQAGIVAGSKTFALDQTNLAFYSLEIDLSMVGRTTYLAPPESWSATFVVRTPPMTITPVPEPTTVASMALGLAMLAVLRRRRGGSHLR